MTKQATKYQKLVIVKKGQIKALLSSLKQEKKSATTNQQQPLNPATYNDYRWLIKAEEEETDGQ